MGLTLTSTAFRDGGRIPGRHSKSGGNASPMLEWSGVPKGAKSLALIVDDPDAPGGVFVHWVVYGIPANMDRLPENVPPKPQLPRGIRQGKNDFGTIGYGGPQPPRGTHRYIFHLYAVDEEIGLPPGAGREELDRATRGHVLEEARLTGLFEQGRGSHAA
jgi:Raf kinase inhibitor-like YbhB/YbcL family protein